MSGHGRSASRSIPTTVLHPAVCNEVRGSDDIGLVNHAIGRGRYSQSTWWKGVSERPKLLSALGELIVDRSLESACSRTRSKPFSDLLPKLLTDQSHPVNTERAKWRGIIEKPRQNPDIGSVGFESRAFRWVCRVAIGLFCRYSPV